MHFMSTTHMVKLLLVAMIVFFVATEEFAEARKRPKREPKCALRISEDGRYAVVCARSKSSRKTKVSARGLRKVKRTKKTSLKKSSNLKLGNLTPDQVKKFARSSSDKRRNRLLVCKDRSSKWVPRISFPSSDLVVNCYAREFLQGFSLQRQGEKVQYKFTCCSFA